MLYNERDQRGARFRNILADAPQSPNDRFMISERSRLLTEPDVDGRADAFGNHGYCGSMQFGDSFGQRQT